MTCEKCNALLRNSFPTLETKFLAKDRRALRKSGLITGVCKGLHALLGRLVLLCYLSLGARVNNKR